MLRMPPVAANHGFDFVASGPTKHTGFRQTAFLGSGIDAHLRADPFVAQCGWEAAVGKGLVQGLRSVGRIDSC